MSDATYIELPPVPRKKRRFWKSWRGAVLLLFLAAVGLAGCFSWWLSQGKISSAYARVDTVVFTVQPEAVSRIEQVLVRPGEEVTSGQPLARVNLDITGMPSQPAPSSADNSYIGRLHASKETEGRLSTQLAQARAQEEHYSRLHQERVTEHVNAQLALRALSPGDGPLWEQARRAESSARQRMEKAREEFENVSKMRAAMDMELGRIRFELVRKKRSPLAPPKTDAIPPTVEAKTETLYAPVGGKIMEINAGPGQVVYSGQPVFMILPADNGADIWIQAWFPLSAQQMLKLGQKASIKSGNLHFTGRVAAIGSEVQYLPAANSTSRQEYAQYLPARIQLENAADLAKLKPGSNVECQIQTRYVLGEGLI